MRPPAAGCADARPGGEEDDNEQHTGEYTQSVLITGTSGFTIRIRPKKELSAMVVQVEARRHNIRPDPRSQAIARRPEPVVR